MVQPLVLLETSVGEILLELDPENAPGTVRNFLAYVDNKDKGSETEISPQILLSS